MRPEAHIASKREIEKNNAWDAYIGAYNAAMAAQRNAGKAYVVLYVGRRYFWDGGRPRSHRKAT